MTSWLPDKRVEPNYRRRGLHMADYGHNEGIGQEKFDGYRRIGHFAVPGVEKQSGATGLAYGSEKSYLAPKKSWNGHQLDNRTSAERIKLKKQQREIEEDHQMNLVKREEERRGMVEEKRKDLNMLQKYNPWGKPAGGAPRITPSGTSNARMQNLKFDLDTESSPDVKVNDSGDYSPYGKPGAGAPLRTKSGKVHTLIKGAKDIRFQEHLKKEVECLRYKPDGLTGSEGRTSQQNNHDQSLDRADSEKLRMLENREKKAKYAQKLEEQRLEAIDRREREKREEKKAPPDRYLWGKSSVHRDESGKLLPRKWVIESDSYTECPSESDGLAVRMGKEGCGAPVKDHRGNVNTKIPRNTVHNSGQSSDDFDPWGRPGAGAPLRDKQGQVVAAGVYGKHTGEMEKRSAHKKVVVDKTRASRDNGIDVATWLRAGEMGRSDLSHPEIGKSIGATRSTSDVTSNRYATCPGYKDYFTDLQAQAEFRYKQLQQKRNEDRELDALHAETAAQMWDTGCPPGGRKSRNDGPRDDHKVQRIKKYSDDLRQAIEDKSFQKKRSRENNIQIEKQHMTTFNQHWGRPGAGAPRMDSQGQLDAVPKNIGSLEAQVHTGWHYRNA